MAFDLSLLTVYTDQHKDAIKKAIVLEATTVKNNLVTVEFGATGNAYQLNTLKHTPIGKSNDGCSTFSNSGSTQFAPATITIFPIKFETNACINDLKKYFTAEMQTASMNDEDLGDQSEVYTAAVMEATSKELDQCFWRAANSSPKYASTSGNLALFDGFLQKAYSLSASTQTPVTRVAFNASNAFDIVDAVYTGATANMPEVEDLNMYISPADFGFYMLKYRNFNSFTYTTDSKNVTQIDHPGTASMKVVRTNGLKGALSGSFLASSKENMYLILSDKNDLDYKGEYDFKDDVFLSRLKTRVGTGFRQPELVMFSYI